MGTLTYCGSCDKETTRFSFNCLECNSTYCPECVGEAKDYGEGVREFRCLECGNSLYLPLPPPAALSRLFEALPDGIPEVAEGTLKDLHKEGPIRTGLHPNKRASRPRSDGVKQGAKGDDSKMTWMQTFTGKAYVIHDPTPDQICLEDIAHALSNQCRFAGHSKHFYSVAEHSVYVCNRVREVLEIGKAINHAELDEEDRKIIAVALLHDAAEAYLLDIPRPLKIEPEMAFYRRIHDETLVIILEKFGLPTEKLDIIKHVDNELLATEKEQIMAVPPGDWVPLPDPLPITIDCWDSSRAYNVFMKQAQALGLTDGND